MTATMATTAAPIGLYEHLKDDLGYLKLTRAAEILPGLLDRARAEQLTHAQFLAELLAEEAAATRNRRMAARLRFAPSPARRILEEFDFDFQPSVDPKLVADLASLRFVAEGHPLLLLGQPGCGKSHLAIALATLAVEAGYRGYFTSAADLVASITTAYADGSFGHKIRTYTGPSVLVVDDVGLTPMDRAAGNALFQVINRRYDNGATTPRGLPAWGELFGDPVVAAAILDRLLHRAVVINIKGPSWRLREHQGLVDRTRQGGGASSLSALNCGAGRLQLDAGVLGREAPVDATTGGVARCLPRGDLPLQRRLVGQAAVQAPPGQHGQPGLGHVQPAAVLGGVVQLQPVGQPFGLGRWERR